MKARNTAYILYEKLPECARFVAGDDRHVAHSSAVVNALVDAFHLIGTRAEIYEIVLTGVHVPCAPAVHDQGKCHSID